MPEPTREQEAVFHELATEYASVGVEVLPPMGALLCLATCRDERGRKLAMFYVYASGLRSRCSSRQFEVRYSRGRRAA